jgi:hypothetical protein
MECNVNKIGYFLVALIWNIAVLSVVGFLAAWPLDIFGYAIGNNIIRGYAYGIGIIASISIFWFGLLAAILSSFVKCKSCYSRIISLRYPFFVSLIKSRCVNCEKSHS